jgi:Homeobox KN domain
MITDFESHYSKNGKQHVVERNREVTLSVDCDTILPVTIVKKEAIVTKYPKYQTDILMKWMIEHKHNPCPTLADIEYLKIHTGLNGQQITNWTTNVRKRNVKATTKNGKKPHHFIDFLFLSYQHDRQQQLIQFNNEIKGKNQYSASKIKQLNKTRADTANTISSISEHSILPVSDDVLQNNGDNADCINNKDEEEDDDDTSSKWNNNNTNVHFESISPEHEIELLQNVNTFDVDLPYIDSICAGTPPPTTVGLIKSSYIVPNYCCQPIQSTMNGMVVNKTNDITQMINSSHHTVISPERHENTNKLLLQTSMPMMIDSSYLTWNSSIDGTTINNVPNNVSSSTCPEEKVTSNHQCLVPNTKKWKIKKRYNIHQRQEQIKRRKKTAYQQHKSLLKVESNDDTSEFVVTPTMSFDNISALIEDDEFKLLINETYYSTVEPV